MAYRLLREFRQAFNRLDTPPFSNRRHPGSDIAQWALKSGQSFANQVRRRLPAAGDKWHMDEVVLTISGVKHWL